MPRDLDFEIADRVFHFPKDWINDDVEGKVVEVGGSLGRTRISRTPEYSARIQDAFEVVERMRQDGWDFTLSTTSIQKGTSTVAIFDREYGDTGRGAAGSHLDSSIEVAICQAALKAILDRDRVANTERSE